MTSVARNCALSAFGEGTKTADYQALQHENTVDNAADIRASLVLLSPAIGLLGFMLLRMGGVL